MVRSTNFSTDLNGNFGEKMNKSDVLTIDELLAELLDVGLLFFFGEVFGAARRRQRHDHAQQGHHPVDHRFHEDEA